MTIKERILSIRIAEKIQKNNSYADKLGITFITNSTNKVIPKIK